MCGKQAEVSAVNGRRGEGVGAEFRSEIVVSEVEDEQRPGIAQHGVAEVRQAVVAKVEFGQRAMKSCQSVVGDLLHGVVRDVQSTNTRQSVLLHGRQTIKRQIQRRHHTYLCKQNNDDHNNSSSSFAGMGSFLCELVVMISETVRDRMSVTINH